MDFSLVHAFLVESYWAKGIPKKVLEEALNNSLCFGLFIEGDDKLFQQQIAFGRFVTDGATFAYLADVFVIPGYRGQGLAKMMMVEALELSDLKGLRRIMLATRDAHGLYEKLGFEALTTPESFMQRWNPNVYRA